MAMTVRRVSVTRGAPGLPLKPFSVSCGPQARVRVRARRQVACRLRPWPRLPRGAPAAARKQAPAPAPLATSGPVPPGVALDEFVTFDARPSARRAPVARART